MEREKAEALLSQLERRLQEKDGKGLPASQRAVLYACLCSANPPYKNMPDTLQNAGYGHYNWKTLKTDGYTVFKRLSNALGEDIKKKNCLRKLVDWHNSHRPAPESLQASLARRQSPSPSAHPQSPQDLLLFSSWQSVLAELPQAIRKGHRVVAITGAAGIGKTYFTHALVDRLQTDFEAIMWCQASDVPTVDHLLRHIQRRLAAPALTEYSPPQSPGFSDGLEYAVPKLLELLRTRRILVVVDQTEDLYRLHQFAGAFKEHSASYETWLKRLLKLPFDGSCLIWVGREPPACFSPQYGVLANLQLTGLPESDAKQLLDARNMTGRSQVGLRLREPTNRSLALTTDPYWKKFVTFCGGNPAWLLREATMMRRSHTLDILQFIAKPSLEPGLKATLSQILEALSLVEFLLLSWLLLKPLSYLEICSLDSPNISTSDWEMALTSLYEYRSLVTLDSDQRYRLHPPLLRYVLADSIVQNITRALWEQPSPSNLTILCTCPLFQGSTSAEQQQWLWDNVVNTMARQFQQGPLRSDRLHPGLFRQEQIERLQSLLMTLHQQPKAIHGYGASNLLNLAVALKLPLSEFDVRGLAIRHVDLRRANITGANFEECSFENTLFPLNLRGRLAAAMTSDGHGIAIGDATGALLYWQRDGEGFRLQAVSQLPSDDSIAQSYGSEQMADAPTAIETVLFQDPHTLIIVSHQRVYSWWIHDPALPTLFTHLSAPVSCVTQRTLPGGMGYVAVGLTNGDIVLWDNMGWDKEGDRTTTLIAHRTEISHLAISPDGTALVSVCSGNQGLIWDLRPHQPSGPSYQEWSLGMNPCFDVGWTTKGRLRAEADPQAIRLRVRSESSTLNYLGAQSGFGPTMTSLTSIEKTDISEREIAPGHLVGLRFSQNGRYLSGSGIGEDGDGLLFCWDWHADTLHSIQQSSGCSDIVATCEVGRLLLATQPNRIQVFDLEQGELLWQIESQDYQQGENQRWDHHSEISYTQTNLQGVRGLSDAQQKRLHMLMDSPGKGAIAFQNQELPTAPTL